MLWRGFKVVWIPAFAGMTGWRGGGLARWRVGGSALAPRLIKANQGDLLIEEIDIERLFARLRS